MIGRDEEIDLLLRRWTPDLRLAREQDNPRRVASR
jgi:hypothetical protein